MFRPLTGHLQVLQVSSTLLPNCCCNDCNNCIRSLYIRNRMQSLKIAKHLVYIFIGYLGLYFHGYFALFECLDGNECRNLDVFSFLPEGYFMLLVIIL
jgi:hypothetical protein